MTAEGAAAEPGPELVAEADPEPLTIDTEVVVVVMASAVELEGAVAVGV